MAKCQRYCCSNGGVLLRFKKIFTNYKKKTKQNLYVNLESIQSFKNINQILKQPNIKRLTGVVIGRSDLAGSLNLEKRS